MANFSLDGYGSIIPNLLYQNNDQFIIASRLKEVSNDQVVSSIKDSAQWLMNLYERISSGVANAEEEIEIEYVPSVLAEGLDFAIIKEIAENDPNFVDYLGRSIPFDHNTGQEHLYLEIGQINDEGVKALQNYNCDDYDVTISDLASGLMEGSNTLDLSLGLDNGELPCHGDVIYLLDEHGVKRSTTIQVYRYMQRSPDIKKILSSLYGGSSSALEISQLHDISYRDLKSTAEATIENFSDNIDRIIDNIEKRREEKEKKELDQILADVEGAYKWNWGGNKGKA
jgi:hypothetical protein